MPWAVSPMRRSRVSDRVRSKVRMVYGRPMHNTRVVFNEDVLPLGAALHTWCAVNFLKAE